MPFAVSTLEIVTARIILNPSVILVETGKEHRPEVATILEANGFQVLPCRSIFDLEKLCQEDDHGVVILNLDDPLMNNRVLKEVKRKRPALQIIGISSRLFHPRFEGGHCKSYLRLPL